MGSRFLFCLSWLGAVLTVVATAVCVVIISGGNDCWSVLAFTLGIALPLGCGLMLFGVIPSIILYLATRQRRDWISLVLTGSSLFILLFETMLINFIITQGRE
jgi:hypothetical protein